MLVADGVAYASTRAMDEQIISAFKRAETGRLLRSGAKAKTFSLQGFPNALIDAGYKAPPGLAATTEDCGDPNS